jgi:periplasmic divalent cation tolerance protein
MTARSKQQAQEIGEALIQDKLAACVNIIDGMESMFFWQGKVESDDETIVVAKTKASVMEGFKQKVKEVHSDDCPCIVGLPIKAGNEDFINWIQEETK